MDKKLVDAAFNAAPTSKLIREFALLHRVSANDLMPSKEHLLDLQAAELLEGCAIRLESINR